MAFCNCGEFIAAKVGNSFCNFVHFYFTTNILVPILMVGMIEKISIKLKQN